MTDFLVGHFSYVYRHFLNAVFNGMLPVLAISGTIWLIFLLPPLRRYGKIAAIFALIGATIGLLTGASREAAVQATLPAMIALITGYLTWLLKQAGSGQETMLVRLATSQPPGQPDDFKNATALVASAVFGLMLAAPAGTMWGASLRDASTANDRRYEEWRFGYENQAVPLWTEVLRRDLGLPPLQGNGGDNPTTPESPDGADETNPSSGSASSD